MIKINKIILLVGLIGSGKTSVGKRLAKKLNLPFIDGDQEIEKAAGLSVIDVFKCFGMEEYRAGEERIGFYPVLPAFWPQEEELLLPTKPDNLQKRRL